ncbi:hypothetical protein [Bifidobacterium porcinum]|uniref:hypothetical protein n=1 Tax=Bifidobacterium porcinum TaxID=212365 RepID=UPI003993E1B0
MLISAGAAILAAALAVPAHAADVQIYDMLDAESVSITKPKTDGLVSGTAPFDKDDRPGDDSTPDDTMAYYRKARVGFHI